MLQVFILDKTSCRKASLETFLKSLVVTIFGLHFANFLLNTVRVILWKYEKPLSTKQVLQKLCGLLIRSKSIQEEFCSFLRKKGV